MESTKESANMAPEETMRMGRPPRQWLGCCLLALLPGWALAADVPAADPLDSPRWEDMRKEFFPRDPVVFDERVKVSGPLTAENPLHVPVAVDATALPGVREVLVFADFNPIVKVLSFEPGAASASLAFRVKLQQSTPVRAAARTADGSWHVGGTWVNTTGGGCTLPSTGSASPEWQKRLNEVSGRIWRSSPDKPGGRVRIRLVHPMDTGLAAGIPAFFIQDLELSDPAGERLMHIHAFEPVSENPLFTLDLPPGLGDLTRVKVTGMDNNGNRIRAWVER
jgi:sulfur-oxidizing protein SoxY